MPSELAELQFEQRHGFVDFSGVIDATSDLIVIPQDGWYTLSATALWNTGAIATQHAGFGEIYIYKNGNTTPGNEIGASGSITEIVNTAPLILTSLDYQSLTLTTVFNKTDTVQFNAFNGIFTSTGGGTSITTKFTALAVDFLGTTPTAVQ